MTTTSDNADCLTFEEQEYGLVYVLAWVRLDDFERDRRNDMLVPAHLLGRKARQDLQYAWDFDAP